MFSISLTKLHLQKKLIPFTNFSVYNYDIKMLREKIKETNVSSSNKWKFSNTMPLCHIFSLSACSPLWKMSRKKVNNLSTKKEVYQFQVVCVSYRNLKKQGIQVKIDKCLSQQSGVRKSQHMIKTLKQENNLVIYLIIFNENRKSLIFKILCVVVCFLIEKYVCVDYFSLQREPELSSQDIVF